MTNGEHKNIIIDFDSTFVTVEALDELSRLALSAHPDRDLIVAEIERITALGMEGKIPFDESLKRRIGLLQAEKQHIDELAEKMKGSVSSSIQKNKDFFMENRSDIYLISGGFKEIILPVATDFGIYPEHVYANIFRFDSGGKVIGVDENNHLSKAGGKKAQIKALGLSGFTCIIGDGFTDWEIKDAGLADRFVYFAENVHRPNVAKQADYVVKTFDEFLAQESLGG